MKRCKFSSLLLSDTGEGKTTQIGSMALWHFKKTGGFFQGDTAIGGQRTVLYAGDFGGWSGIQGLIDLGIITLVDLTQVVDANEESHPFDWLDKIARCLIWTEEDGWTTPPGSYTHFAYDSGTTMAYLLLENLRNRAAKGENIGGGPGYKVTDGDVVVAANNQTHYGIVQAAILKAVAKSQMSTEGLITWSFRLRRTEAEGGEQIIGPQVAGGAMTPELPAWFTYTFRLAKQVQLGQPTKVVLYYDHHIDPNNPKARTLANGRVPIGVEPPPPTQDPASVPKMLDLLREKAEQSKAAIIAACPPPVVTADSL
jgi:hypothetical protein